MHVPFVVSPAAIIAEQTNDGGDSSVESDFKFKKQLVDSLSLRLIPFLIAKN